MDAVHLISLVYPEGDSEAPFKPLLNLAVLIRFPNMKLVVLAALALIVMATTTTYTNRIALERGKRNTLNFACGAVDKRSGKQGLYRENYSYTFSGHPKWFTANGASLDGVVPAGTTGDFPITVGYKSFDGKRKGSQTFTLSCLNQQEPSKPVKGLFGIFGGIIGGLFGLANAVVGTFLKIGFGLFQTGLGKYTILCPTIPATEAAPEKIYFLDTTGNQIPNDVSVGVSGSVTTPSRSASAGASTGGPTSGSTGGNSIAVGEPSPDDSTTNTVPVDTTPPPVDTTPIDTVPVDPSTVTPTDAVPVDTTTIASGSPGIDGGVKGSVGGSGTVVELGGGSTGSPTIAVSTSTGAVVGGSNTRVKFGDYSCSTGNPSVLNFSGIVTAINDDSIVLDSKHTIRFGSCTQRKFGHGKKNFSLKDKVSISGWNAKDKSMWAKSAACNCA